MAPVLRRLGRFSRLTADEFDQVAAQVATRRRWRAGTVLLAEARATGPHFVIAGWACSQRVLRDGRRQIFDFVVPGEGFGFEAALPGSAGVNVLALTSVETVEAGALLAAVRGGPPGGLWRAIRALRLEEEARRMDHLVRLGRLTAYERAAHFIVDMQRRVTVPEARSFPMPLTQEAMADALGLSVVHLNRVLRQLRGAHVAEIRGGVATIHDPKALAAAAVLAPAAEAPSGPA